MKHIHAELMMQYAEDAMNNDKPWLLWESKDEHDECWKTRFVHPRWIKEVQYRRKPKTININGFEVPEPLREYPEVGTVIFLASTNCTMGNNHSKWRNDYTYLEWLEKGIVHLTSEAAQEHINAILSFTRKDNKS
jgi:hypothetical protein